MRLDLEKCCNIISWWSNVLTWRNTIKNTARCWGPWRNWRCPGRTTATAILELSPPYRRQQACSKYYRSNVNRL